ncbi:MAG TPA: endonuclease/exonuclease/phosphatase family protein [Bacteriovoracaceae bacterium]|nr:endonuclease/exonuclease/phosphatase family protein [Bacteriovoracaceae bacterium]
MKLLFFIFLLTLISLLGFLAWSSYPWSNQERVMTPEILSFETESIMDVEESPSVIRLLSWNIGFLYGKGSEGPGYAFREKEFYLSRLEQLVTEIKNWNPDILCLQEVDFDSYRSHGINQARYLAQKAGYPYVAEAVSWESNYIPFPYLPVKNNFGRISSGGAVLSKYPLSNHQVTLLAKPAAQPWWYNLFYLHRYFQRVTVEIGTKKIRLLNLHLEAFDKVDREGQVKKLMALAASGGPDMLVGDFNMVPEIATKKRKFFNDDDYENDRSFSLLQKSSYLEVIPDAIYSKNEQAYFTFPAWAPDRRLDYIFYQQGLKLTKAEVLPSALSDHLPIWASFLIDTPKFNPYSQ